MSRLNWIITLLLLWTSLAAEPTVGVSPIQGENRNIVEREKQYNGIRYSEKPSQVAIIDRRKKEVSNSKTAASEKPPESVNPMRSGKGPFPVVAREMEVYTPEDPDYCCYENDYNDSDCCFYEPYGECKDCCYPVGRFKKWLVPAVAVGGIIGAGVYSSLGNNCSDCPELSQESAGDLFFEFDIDINTGDTTLDLSFEIRLPNDTVFQSFFTDDTSSPTLTSNTIFNVLAGSQYTVVATDYDSNAQVIFTMRAYLNGDLFDTQVLTFVGDPAVPAPPQTFTFTIPSS